MRAPFLPDPAKSWELRLAIQVIIGQCGRDQAILDLGCKNSAILPCLAAMGYRDLYGIDLDPSIERQPTFGHIRWCVGDFYASGFSHEAFAAITAISTIEHGLDLDRLCRETARLLRPGGIFVFSTDFSQEKIDTSEVTAFGVKWSIFSHSEILDLLARFEREGLVPSGEISLTQVSKPIRWLGRQYTFLFGVLQRNAPCHTSRS